MTKKDKRNIPDLRIDDTRLREFMTLSSEAIWCFEIVPPVDTNLSLKQQTGLIFQNAILTEVNPAYARIAGYDDPNDMLGLRLNDMMPQSIPQNVATVEEFIQAGYNIDKVETVEPYELEVCVVPGYGCCSYRCSGHDHGRNRDRKRTYCQSHPQCEHS